MRKLPDTAGFVGYGETSWETGDPSETSPGKIFYKDLIRKANTVPLVQIFKHYGIHLGGYNLQTTCPFKSHKGGRESTPSFTYYPHTNSFYCHGCKTGNEWSHGCKFIAKYEGISEVQAAYKILQLFKGYVNANEEEIDEYFNSTEALEIMLDFSNTVREFRETHYDDKSKEFIECLCLVYDDLYARQNNKHRRLDSVALRQIVDNLKEKIISYK